MASLIDTLIETLYKESEAYEELTELSMKKTPIIIKGDIGALQAITDEEQLVVGKINRIDNERRRVMKDIAGVINTDVETLKLIDLIHVLERRPSEKQKLAACHDKLKESVYRMKQVNDQNAKLIADALEMTRFEMNMLQAMKSAPETANYNKGAYNDGSVIGATMGRFDAKQ